MQVARGRESHRLRTVLWRRLDVPWYDRCTVRQGGRRPSEPWWLEGTVVGASGGEPLDVRYLVACDKDWATVEAAVVARIGNEIREIELGVERDGRWLVGQTEVPEVRGAVDVDLQFTPATNTLPIRRLGLQVGDSQEVQAAWVRFPELTVEPLPQRYTRLAEHRYLYESLTSDFRAELAVDDLGLVIEYQDLWVRSAEASSQASTPDPTG